MIKFNETYSINNGQESIVFKKGNGNTITGVYNDGTLTGTMEGNLLKAIFHNKKSNGAGLIEFTFNANGFDCKWKQGVEPGPMRGKWTGKLDDAAATKAAKTPAPKQEPITAPKETPKPKEVEKVVSKPTPVQQKDNKLYYTITVRISAKYKRTKMVPSHKDFSQWYYNIKGVWRIRGLPEPDSSITATAIVSVESMDSDYDPKSLKINQKIIKALFEDGCNISLADYFVTIELKDKDGHLVSEACDYKEDFKIDILSIN